MKFILYLVLTFMLGQVAAHDVPIFTNGGSIGYATKDLLRRRGELTPPPDIFGLEEMNRVLFSEIRGQNNDLKKVKYYLINGDIRLARIYLSRLAYTQTKLKPIINRYQATLAFIDNDFQKTYDFLSLPELQSIPQFAKICILKVLSEIVLNKTAELDSDWGRCQIENPGNFREKNLVWLETLVQLKLNPKRGITKVPFKKLKLAALDLEETKVMMKLALYLNQEELLVEQIPELTLEQLQDEEIREIAGQAFFRVGSLAKAYRFVEDLKSPNSESIKGNLYLLRNKYELAYAQFKLALEQKINSQNAMERLLPLAWLLGDWESGSKYSEQVIASPQTQINKMTLMAAFYMQKGDYEKSDRILNSIIQRSRRGDDIEVTQLASFTGLMQNKPDKIQKAAFTSCGQYDLNNCWTLMQLSQWEAFPLTIRREDAIPENKLWEKLTTEDLNAPLKETVFVNQLDIEEMDDRLIQLVPTP